MIGGFEYVGCINTKSMMTSEVHCYRNCAIETGDFDSWDSCVGEEIAEYGGGSEVWHIQ